MLLRIVSNQFYTFQTFVEDGCTSSSCFKGRFPDMLFLLQEKLNFTFKIIYEKSIGSEQENGSWTGLLGELILKCNKIFEKICDLWWAFLHCLNAFDSLFSFKGLTANGEVDFAISPMLLRENRAKVVDYLITKEDAYIGYFYIKNPRHTYDWTVFFQPLWEEAWIGLIVFTFVTPLLIAMIAFVRKLI